MYRYLFVLFFYCSWLPALQAQEIRREDFFIADDYARDVGPMKDLNLGTIVDSLSKKCTSDQQKIRELLVTRTFYYWLGHNISFDVKAYHHPQQNAGSASAALMERQATSEGFANLFKAMCDLAHIDCEVVTGVYRRSINDIGNFDADKRHFWNIVQIDGSKFLMDASLGAGITDEAVRHFDPTFSDAWWLANRLCFALMHFPDDNSKQLLELPVTKAEFTQAPLIHGGATISGLIPAKSIKGTLRGREDTSIQIKCNPQRPIHSISLSYDGAEKKPAVFKAGEYGFWITIPYGPAGEHRIDLYANDKLAFTFKTDVRPAPKKDHGN